MKQRILLLFTIFLACESPFSTEPTDNDIFSVTHNYNGEKIYLPTPITIEWSNITIKNFKEFLVERSADYGDSIAWEERAHIQDSLQVTYIDTIDDDVTFQYRIRMVDQDDQYIHGLSPPLEVPKVSSLKVPEHHEDPQKAFDSKFLDDGDTIKVFPGLYRGHFEFLDKNVVIRAVMIPEITLLVAASGRSSVVTVNMGELNGFTVTGGRSLTGGGVHAGGTAIIRNCIIRNNRAIIDEDTKTQIYPNGMGGGVYLQDDAQMIESRVTKNYSQREGAGVLTDGNNNIIRCKIDNNSIYAHSQGSVYNYAGVYQFEGNLNIRNTILRNNYTTQRGQGGGLGVNGTTDVTNCLIIKNGASNGGSGLTVGVSGVATVTNCVLYKNLATTTGWGLGNSGAVANNGTLTIINTIIWANKGGKDNRLYPHVATYTDSDEFRVLFGTGNINIDPLFVNLSIGDYHLQTNSPCINKGNPDGAYNDTDGSRNDMGIYGGPYGDSW